MNLKQWAIKEVESWLNSYMLQFKGQLDKDGGWTDPLSLCEIGSLRSKNPLWSHPEGVRLLLISFGYFGYPLMESEFNEMYEYILLHSDDTFIQILKAFDMDDFSMGSIEGIVSLDNPILREPDKLPIYQSINDKCMEYIKYRGW